MIVKAQLQIRFKLNSSVGSQTPALAAKENLRSAPPGKLVEIHLEIMYPYYNSLISDNRASVQNIPRGAEASNTYDL